VTVFNAWPALGTTSTFSYGSGKGDLTKVVSPAGT
jgi:hypothetical protein